MYQCDDTLPLLNLKVNREMDAVMDLFHILIMVVDTQIYTSEKYC